MKRTTIIRIINTCVFTLTLSSIWIIHDYIVCGQIIDRPIDNFIMCLIMALIYIAISNKDKKRNRDS